MIPEACDDDYYSVLGVRQTATAEQIKQAFRSKAKLLHPDRNRSAGATDAFIRLGEAYRVLRDDEQRLVFDAFRATMAPPPLRRRPAWRAAVVMVALLVSIGASSTFGYLALSGAPATVVVQSAPATPVRVASATASLLPLAGEKPAPDLIRGGLRVIGGRMRDDAAEGDLRHRQPPAPSPLIRPGATTPSRSAGAAPGPAWPLPTQGPPRIKSGAGSSPASGIRSAPPPDADEALVASLSDSVDAPFAVSQTAPVLKPAPRGQPRVSDAAGQKAQQATATAASPHRLAQQVGATPKSATVTPMAPHKPVVRAYAKPPYLVRVVRPYRVAAYPPYPRAYVRRLPIRRYQSPQWARTVAADDWPF